MGDLTWKYDGNVYRCTTNKALVIEPYPHPERQGITRYRLLRDGVVVGTASQLKIAKEKANG